MRKTILIALVLISSQGFSQTIKEIDSLSYKMCDYLKEMKPQNDTLKIEVLFEAELYPYLRKLDEAKADGVGLQVYYRLQRNCVEFRDLLDRLAPPKEAPVRFNEKPSPEISKKHLKEFKNQKNFYYFEASGDTTKVAMENGLWIDSFSDKTASKLSYKWLNDTEFELVFIESDNHSRSNYSVKGDKLIYQVLAKEKGYYSLSVNILGQSVYEKFRVYFN